MSSQAFLILLLIMFSCRGFAAMHSNLEFPLIEPGKTGDTSLVTFLWKGDQNTQNVWLYSDALPEPHIMQMTRLDDSDLFQVSKEIPNDLSISYAFLTNLDLGDNFQPQQLWSLLTQFKIDPKNPLVQSAKDEETKVEIATSILQMPHFIHHNWMENQRYPQKGTLESYSIDSRVLNENRRYHIYTPHNFQSDQTYDLLLVFDGEMYLQPILYLPHLLDRLIGEKKIKPLVAVFVDNMGFSRRMRDLMGSEAFTHFLSDELLPPVFKNYHIGTSNACMGSSLGGLYALQFAMKHNSSFQKVLTNSAAFGHLFTGAAPQLPDIGQLNMKIFMNYGQLEGVEMIQKPNLMMKERLEQLGCEVNCQEFKGGHTYFSWRETLDDGLTYLFNSQ